MRVIAMNSGALDASSGSDATRSTRVTGTGAGGISAESPRPSPFRLAILDPFQQLLGELQIAERALGVDVVEQRGLAVTRRFRETDVARNHGAKDPVPKVLACLARHLQREGVA